MATIMPKSELVKRAIVYMDELRLQKPNASLAQLLDETGMRFNLGPADADNLQQLFCSRNDCSQNKR